MRRGSFIARDISLRNFAQAASNVPCRSSGPAVCHRTGVAHTARGVRLRRHHDHPRQSSASRVGVAASCVVVAILVRRRRRSPGTLPPTAAGAARGGVESRARLGAAFSLLCDSAFGRNRVCPVAPAARRCGRDGGDHRGGVVRVASTTRRSDRECREHIGARCRAVHARPHLRAGSSLIARGRGASNGRGPGNHRRAARRGGDRREGVGAAGDPDRGADRLGMGQGSQSVAVACVRASERA